MAAVADTFDQDLISRDQEESARRRELRMNRLLARSRQQNNQTLSAVGQAEQLLKQAKQVRNVFTLIGAFTATTGIGIIWTVIQWNLQMIWTVFGLPGDKYGGLSWWLVPVILVIDGAVFLAIVMLVLVAWVSTYKADTICQLGPALMNDLAGKGVISSILGKIITWTACATS